MSKTIKNDNLAVPDGIMGIISLYKSVFGHMFEPNTPTAINKLNNNNQPDQKENNNVEL